MEPSSDNTNRPVKTTSDNTSRTVMASADSTSGSVKASSDAEDIVTGGKNNEEIPWRLTDEFLLNKAANEMKCDWAKILTSEKYSGVFAGRTADELRDKYKNMEKDKYEQMLKNTKKKQQMEGSSRDCMMLLDNGKNNMLEAVLVRNELLRMTLDTMDIAVNIMQAEEEEKEE